MEILQKFECTSRIGLNFDIVQKSFSTIFRLYFVYFCAVSRWTKKFWEGLENVENKPGTGRKVSNSTKNVEVKIKKLLEINARDTIRELAKAVGISSSKVHFILRKRLCTRKISARWSPHLLSDDKKRARVTYAKNILKLYPSFDKKKFANIVTGDETWIHFY